MDRLLEWLTAPLSRTAKFVVLPIVGFVLVLFFVFMGFPYEVIADRAVATVERQTGATIRYSTFSPRITVGGPGFSMRLVDVTLADGTRFSVDPLKVRPAWSLGWLTGSPAIHTELASDHGQLDGVVTIGRSWGWSGTATDVDLAVLPGLEAQGIELEGRADIVADVLLEDDLPVGEIELAARAGELAHSQVPFPLEFETADGQLTFGDEALARIERFELEGPLVALTARGEVGESESTLRAPLDIEIDLTVREQGMMQMARNMGVDLDRSGRTRISVGGTLGSPEVR